MSNPAGSKRSVASALLGGAEWLADRVEWLIVFASHGVLLFLLRLVNLAVTWPELRHGGYSQDYHNLELSQALDAEEAVFLFHEQEKSSDHTDEKLRQLLTLGTALAALISVFGRGAFGDLLVISVVACLLAAVLLSIAGVSGVRTHSLPGLSDPQAQGAKDEWARSLITALKANANTHALRVDMYRAAVRWFVLALIVFSAALSREVISARAATEDQCDVLRRDAATDSAAARTFASPDSAVAAPTQRPAAGRPDSTVPDSAEGSDGGGQ